MIRIISLGAGVQSSTMALMAATGEIEQPDCAIFADTQAEPQSVYDWLDWLEGQLPYPVHRVTAGDLAAGVLDIHTTRDGRAFTKINVPFFIKNDDGSQGRVAMRSCTRDYKIYPIIRKAREMVGKERMKKWRKDHRSALSEIARYKREEAASKKNKTAKPRFPFEAWEECQADALIEQWIGISTDEATRMKQSRDPWIRNRWPLIEARMKRSDCLLWMAEREFPKPPRSACVFCPFHDNAEWRRLKADEPEEFQRAVEFEIAVQKAKAVGGKFKSVPYLHRSLTPLEAVDLSTAEERGQPNLFENECEGMCGV